MKNPATEARRQSMEQSFEKAKYFDDGTERFRNQQTQQNRRKITDSDCEETIRMKFHSSRNKKKKSRYCHESTSEDEHHLEEDDSLQILKETTTLHGLRDVTLSTSKCLKFLWIMILFFALVLTLHGCYEILQEYSKKSVVISYFIQKETSMTLPDILICPLNRFNRSYLEEKNISEPLAQYLELAFPSFIYHPYLIDQRNEILDNADFYDDQLQRMLKIHNLNFSEFIRNAAIDCQSFFPNKKQTDCSLAVAEIYTSAGKCFRFPGPMQNASGYGYGYQFVINLPYELYHTGVNQFMNDGIVVKLVGDGRGINYDMSFIPAGVHALIPLTATRYEFMNDPPRYECKEDFSNTYSPVHCFESCITETCETTCQCSLSASINPRKHEICTPKLVYECVMPTLFGNLDAYLEKLKDCNKKCKSPCNSWAFGKQLSYATLSTSMVAKLTNESMAENLKRTIILDIFYEQLEYTTIKHVVAMPLPSLIAQIGGQFSLWAGGSLISLCQIIIYCSRFIVNRCVSTPTVCVKRRGGRKQIKHLLRSDREELRRRPNQNGGIELKKNNKSADPENRAMVTEMGMTRMEEKCASLARLAEAESSDKEEEGVIMEQQQI